MRIENLLGKGGTAVALLVETVSVTEYMRRFWILKILVSLLRSILRLLSLLFRLLSWVLVIGDIIMRYIKINKKVIFLFLSIVMFLGL